MNPIKNWKKGKKTVIKGVEVKVAHVNAGYTWVSPLKDDYSKKLYVGLAVFKVSPNGEVTDLRGKSWHS